MPPSCFTLSAKEIDQFIKCLVGIKVSSGYCGKISRFLDPKKKRFSGMKSHDCHVMMTQIFPVAIRGIMEKHVRDTLTSLCNFFNVISRKSISVKQLRRLQDEIVAILCVILRCTSRPHSLTSWCICVSTSWMTSSTSSRHSFTA